MRYEVVSEGKSWKNCTTSNVLKIFKILIVFPSLNIATCGNTKRCRMWKISKIKWMLTMVERDDREKLEIQLTLNLHKNQWILWHWFFDGDFKVVKLQGKKRWEKLGWASKYFNQKYCIIWNTLKNKKYFPHAQITSTISYESNFPQWLSDFHRAVLLIRCVVIP